MSSVTALFMMRCNETFLHVKLTRYAKECMLPLAHMLTEYRVTMTQTSNCNLSYDFLSCFFFSVALDSSPYKHHVRKEL